MSSKTILLTLSTFMVVSFVKFNILLTIDLYQDQCSSYMNGTATIAHLERALPMKRGALVTW